MKTSPFILLLGAATLTAATFAQEATPPPVSPPPAPAAAAPDAAKTGIADQGLRFNFRGAPLETVLNYMSDAAGYVIVLETPVRGTVDMWSSQPVSREEAVQLLNLALNKNGYTARVQGRSLVVSSKEDARKQKLLIRTGNDPAEIPETAEMVMQVIPLRHIDATTAVRDLGTLLPSSASVTANQDSNSLIVTDTQINVRHIVEIVAALDGSIDSASTVRVFQLRHADPAEMAQLLTSLFATGTGNPQVAGGGNTNFANRVAAFGGFPGGGAPGGGNNAANRGRSSGGRGTPVVAVADPRTFSIVVTASKAQMLDIAAMINQLDTNSGRQQKVFVYTLQNADVRQTENVLKNLFQSNTTRNTGTSTQADPLGARATNNSQNSNGNNQNLSLGNGNAARNR